MRSSSLITAFSVLAIACACSNDDIGDLDPPLVPELARESRTFGAHDLFDWARATDPITVIHNRSDALPNGLAAKGAPLLVNWVQSEDGDAYVVRNVNVACDPIRGTTTLATVRVPKRGIASAEFVLVRDRKYGKELRTGHGMLRFVFEADHRPTVAVPEGTTWHGDVRLDDLVISYEAWREPGESYDFVAGLEPDRYALTVRSYSGAASFLQAAVKQFQWECYPLQLAGGRDGNEELLRVSLLIGDGLARRILAEALEDGTLEAPEDDLEWSEDDEHRLVELFRRDMVPDDPIESLIGASPISYHSLERSCLTLAMVTIDLTQARMVERLGAGEPRHLAVAPASIPDWIERIPHAGRAEMLARLPGAVVWIAKNQSVLPANAWTILRDGDLLRTVEGRVVKHLYRPEGKTPWGWLAENL
ncbi:MAG: hypothetical protein AAGA20_24115 [Planctomycetota bacterium]